MDGNDKRDVYSICGRELSFRAKFKTSFIIWYEKNHETSDAEEICTKLIESFDIKEDDVKVDSLNNEEKIEILKTVAKEKDFTCKTIHSCDDFLSGFEEYYHTYIEEAAIITLPIIRSIFDSIGNAMLGFSSITQEITKNIDFSGIVKALKLLDNKFQELPKEIIEMHNILMVQGWYLPLSVLLDLEPSYAYKIINSDTDTINHEMLSFAQEIEKNILSEVDSNFVSRHEFISESLNLHEEGNYKISIPIMLIHADGITLDIFGSHLFTRQKQRIDSIKFDETDFMDSLIFSPLITYSAISVPEYKRNDKDYYKFNRHEILHGEDLDYGTRENSYRCIMLLKYLIDVNDYIMKDKQELD